MHLPHALDAAVAWWAAIYSDHRLVSVTVRFLHLVGLVIGGGAAVTADRTVLQAARGDAGMRQAAVATLRKAHGAVVPALVLVAASGALMTLADTDTFFASPIYWTKMALLLVLFANGGAILFAERVADQPAGWRRLAIGSAASLALWIVLVFVGTLLTAAA
jgi:hypothetical protein